KDPYPVDALPTCNHALSVCQQERKCIKLFEDFKTNCKVREGKCRMDDREQCHEAWTKLRLSPMFGCICPNNHMKRRCDRIFSMVNHNPCVELSILIAGDFSRSAKTRLKCLKNNKTKERRRLKSGPPDHKRLKHFRPWSQPLRMPDAVSGETSGNYKPHDNGLQPENLHQDHHSNSGHNLLPPGEIRNKNENTDPDVLPASFDLSGTDSALYPYDPEQGNFRDFLFPPATNLYPYFLFPSNTLRPRLSHTPPHHPSDYDDPDGKLTSSHSGSISVKVISSENATSIEGIESQLENPLVGIRGTTQKDNSALRQELQGITSNGSNSLFDEDGEPRGPSNTPENSKVHSTHNHQIACQPSTASNLSAINRSETRGNCARNVCAKFQYTMCTTMGINYKSVEWRFFIDSSKISLKSTSRIQERNSPYSS
ncbi:hypothetical protein L9F63_023476, partial [Diploptera punctata]